MSDLLLKTKLFIPEPASRIVARQRLNQQLNQGVTAKLTLVAAPAGFGKTTLLSCWLQDKPRLSAWVSLNEDDNDETLFWAYVVNALQQAYAKCNQPLLTKFDPFQLPPAKTLLANLINELTTCEEPTVLVLDDYHVISNPAIHEQISFLIDNNPAQLSVVLSTRADPPLPLARLRAKSQLCELRADALRFTLSESTNLLNEILELELDPTDIEALEQRTEGWVAGLQLAALSMQGRSDKRMFIADFSGSHHFILEYLTEEVLNRLTESQRHFLLQTSVLDSFCANLCDWVVEINNSADSLSELQRSNLFLVPLDDDRIWFRYHHLFADLLRNRLIQDFSQEDILNLYQRASHWYHQHDDLDLAIKYALLAQDYTSAADLIEQIVDQVIARGQVKTLLRWIKALPNEVIQSRPCLLMHQGWIIFLSGQVTLASQILQAAKKALVQLPEGEDRDFLKGRLYAMLSTITALTRDLPAAILEAQDALAYLPQDEFIFRARATRALGVSHTFQGELEAALTYLQRAKSLALDGKNNFLASEICSQIATTRKHQGKLSLAVEAYSQILDLYERPEQAPPACLGYIGLAEIALERNQLEVAETYLKTGVKLCEQGNIGYALQPTYLIGGLLKLALGNPDGARKSIQEGEKLSRMGGGSLESILGLAQFQVRFHLLLGEVHQASDWAAGTVLPSGWTFEALPLVLNEVHQSLLARVYLKTGEYQKVRAICDRNIPKAEASGRGARVVEFRLYKALALQAQGDLYPALENLEKSLSLAEPAGYIRLFLEMGKPAHRLLQVAADRGIVAGYVCQLLGAFSDSLGEPDIKHQTQLMQKLDEPLTERECEVLILIASGYTNQKIADVLVVSLNTVKKHNTHIYGKLMVKNRAQAIAKGRELGLIQ